MKIILSLMILLLPWHSMAGSNKELKIGVSQEFENLNQLISQMAATSYIYNFVARKLVDMDHEGKRYPGIVKEIPTLENKKAKIIGKDKKRHIVAEWEIKDNVVWGDGKPVTGHDVKFSWEVALSKNVSVGETEVYKQIKSIEIDPKNPKKFTLIYKEAKWNFNQLLTYVILPKHIEGPIFNKYKNVAGGYEKHSAYVTQPANPALYNGPYLLTDVKLGSHVVLKKNPKFFGNAAKIEKVVIKVIPSTATLEANLRSGVIDMISIFGLAFDQAVAFNKKVKSQNLPFEVKFKQSLIYEHIDLQLSNELLSDINVRKALIYSINRKDLTKALFDGKLEPAIHNIAPIDKWFTDDPSKIVLYKYSRRKARKLFEKAGWIKGKDGYRYKNGKKLSIQLMTTSGNKTRELVEVYLQDQWKKVGVHITIKNEQARVYFGETVRKSKFPGMAMFAWISSPENNPRSTFHSKSIPTKENGYSGQNSSRWSNKTVDDLIDKVDLEFNETKRIEMVHQILKAYTDEVPVIPLYYRADIAVTPKGMRGHKLNGHQFSSSNHAEFWTF